MKKHIVIVQNTELGSHLALSVYLTGLLSTYSKSDYQFSLICASIEKTKSTDFIEKNFDIFTTNTSLYKVTDNILFSLKTLFHLYKIHKKNRIDFIHCLYPNSSILGTLLYRLFFFKKLKILYDVRSPWIEMSFANSHLSNKRNILRKTMHLSERILTFFIHDFVFISQGTLNYYKKKYSIRGNTSIIPSGVNVNLFKDDQSQVNRDVYGISDSEIIVGYVGTIGKLRELDKFISIHSEDIRQNKVRFMIIGDGDGLEDIKNVIKDCKIENKFIFLGRMSHADVMGHIRLFDYGLCHLPNVFIFENSFPLKVLEYLSSSKRVLASDIYAHREIKKIFHEEIILYKEKINFHELDRAPDSFNPKIYDYDWKNLYKQYKVIYD